MFENNRGCRFKKYWFKL